MRSTWETLLATGGFPQVRSVLAKERRRAVIAAVGENRWAVVPQPVHGDAGTGFLAGLISEVTRGYAASFRVAGADLLSAGIYHDGSCCHSYHSEQGHTTEFWDSDDNLLLVDLLGRVYQEDETRPTGPYGADPEAFAPLGLGPVDLAAIGTVLRGPGDAGARHHDLLRHLNVTPGPLVMTFEEAVESGLGRVTPGWPARPARSR